MLILLVPTCTPNVGVPNRKVRRGADRGPQRPGTGPFQQNGSRRVPFQGTCPPDKCLPGHPWNLNCATNVVIGWLQVLEAFADVSQFGVQKVGVLRQGLASPQSGSTGQAGELRVDQSASAPSLSPSSPSSSSSQFRDASISSRSRPQLSAKEFSILYRSYTP